MQIEKLKNNFNTSIFRYAFFSALIIGLIAHGFIFANAYYVHDVSSSSWPISNSFMGYGANGGRWLADYLSLITFNVKMPWLGGILGLVFIAFSSYFTCICLHIDTKVGIILASGLLMTHRTIILSNMYGGLYGFTAALFAATLGIYLLRDRRTQSCICASLCFFACLSIYSTYILMATSLAVAILAFEILGGDSTESILRSAANYIISFLLGLFLYKAINSLILRIYGLTHTGDVRSASFNSMLSEVIKNLLYAYKVGIISIVEYPAPKWIVYPLITIGIIEAIILFIYRFKYIKDKKYNIPCLFFLTLFCFPLFLNIVYAVYGPLHQLMDYQFVVFFLVIIRICEDLCKCININKLIVLPACFSASFIVILIWFGIYLSNAAYIHLDDSYRISILQCSGLINRIEQQFDSDDVPMDYSIVLIGEFPDNPYFNDSHAKKNMPYLTDERIGMIFLSRDVNTVFTERGASGEYLYSLTGLPYRIHRYYTIEEFESSDPETYSTLVDLDQLPAYPVNGSIIKGDKVIIVNLKP